MWKGARMQKNIFVGLTALGLVGAAVLPNLATAATLDSAALKAGDTKVQTTIGSTIAISTTGTVTVNVVPTAAGNIGTGADTITINSNAAGKVAVTLKDRDSDLNLVGSTNNANVIAASTTTLAGSSGAGAALAKDQWGYRVVATSNGTTTPAADNYVGVTSAGETIYSGTVAKTGGEQFEVTYAINASTDVNPDVYSDVVTYTAVMSP
jgi:hypothetical protein